LFHDSAAYIRMKLATLEKKIYSLFNCSFVHEYISNFRLHISIKKNILTKQF